MRMVNRLGLVGITWLLPRCRVYHEVSEIGARQPVGPFSAAGAQVVRHGWGAINAATTTCRQLYVGSCN